MSAAPAGETGDGPLIYVIAGEPSGDALGGRLIGALRERGPTGLRFAGIGGERMAEQGLQSLVPLHELAIMGVAEVLPRARRILRRVAETVADIQRLRPAAVVTIDSSGFTWRVAQRLRAQGERLPLIHYVAPMVWAWRAGRARRMARWYDHLLVLLPFEPPYFTRVGLACTYVGHPVVESGADRGDGAAFRRRHGIPLDAPLLTVLPGSRRGEVARLVAPFAETVAYLARRKAGLRVVVPTTATVAETVSAAVRDWPVPTIVVRGEREKYDAFAASDAALAASGTVALELAMARLPAVVAYRVSPLTAWVVQRMVKIRYMHLLNLILDRPAVPEFRQADVNAERLGAELERLLTDPAARETQVVQCQEALHRLGLGELSPSRRAADEVLAIIAKRSPDRNQGAARPEIGMEDEMNPTTTAAKTSSAVGIGEARMLHTMLRVFDLKKSLDFYSRLLGMQVLRQREVPDGRYTLAFVGYGDEASSTVVELTHNWDQKEPYALGSAFGHLAIGVRDVYATCETLGKEGVKITRAPGPVKFGTTVIAFIEDPDGYKIELIQRG